MTDRSQAWLRDELILALDLYFREGPNAPATSRTALSNALREFPIEHHLKADPSFRSRASVTRKLGNFRALDPTLPGGLEHSSRGDAEVWAEFDGDHDRLHTVAAAIRDLLASEVAVEDVLGAGDEPDDFAEAAEGELLTRLHTTRERSHKLVRTKKSNALKALGHLRCEVCAFDFATVYGELGERFIECHHTLPVSGLTHRQKTHLDDLALVCSNCHRMIHRRRPWLTLEELRAVLV